MRSLVFNWLREAERFTPRLRVLDYTGTARRIEAIDAGEADLVVTTYGTLRRDAAELSERRFDYVILDEAQAIKTVSSASAKAARLLARALRPVILRRTKAQVATELPARVEQTLHVELEGAQRKFYDHLLESYREASSIVSTAWDSARLVCTFSKRFCACARRHAIRRLLTRASDRRRARSSTR